jgi:UDP-N-acetylmuramate dehydrogenase
MKPSILSDLRTTFNDCFQENVLLSGYTAARVGGPADALVFVRSADELSRAAEFLWKLDVPFLLLGGGSNVLVSDKGVRGVVVINRARLVKFDLRAEPPSVHAESGVTPNDITQRAARLGLSGFEWAAGVPGSLGGAVWPLEKMEFGYRSSLLKREHPFAVILSARLALRHGDPDVIRSKMEQFSERRRKTQPPGASMGSMFKNPTGEKAGRLIEAAGLKGKRIGNAEISTQHANFFINHGETRAEDIKALIDLTRNTVIEKFGINLELEVEFVGEW